MHLFILITVRGITWTDCMFWSCACQCRPSQSCWWGGFSFRKVFTRPLARLASALCYLVLQGESQHLGYLLLMASRPFPIWKVTWGIRSDLEGLVSLLMFRKISEEAPKWSANFLAVPAWAGLSPIQHTWWSPILLLGIIFLGVYALPSLLGLRPSNRLFGGTYRGLLMPRFFLIIRVFRSSWQDFFSIAIDVPGSWFLPSVVFFLRIRRFCQDYFLLSDGIFSITVFSRVLPGWEGKIVVIEDLLAVFFGF